jgi:ankyrin repeat protein
MQTVKELISMGADLETRDTTGTTALMHACMKGQVHLMHILIKAGANIMVRDSARHTLLHWAAYKGHASAIEYLNRFQPQAFTMLEIDEIERTPTHWACR